MTGEHETGSDRIAEAVQNIDCDIVINVQGMNLFWKRTSWPTDKSIRKRSNAEISLASLKIKLHNAEEVQNPNNVKVITDNNGFALYFSRSVIPYPREESFQAEYFKHIGVYAFRKQALLNFARLPAKAFGNSWKLNV